MRSRIQLLTTKNLTLALCVVLCGCASKPTSRSVTYQDVNSAGIVSGVGVESQDIVSISDVMVRDLLSNVAIMKHTTPPRIIMDGEHFKNDSTQPLNKNLLVDRLRINLQRASQGRLQFLSVESAGMVAKAREMKRDGATDTGTTGMTKAQAGGDYRLSGRISTLDSRGKAGKSGDGAVERYSQISFELIDLETGISVWANLYEFKKGGQDDAIYR